jgi:hypothetical protein
MQLKQSELEAFLLDPVLAAWAIMNIELDVFQQARLRLYWFVPEVVDSSGTSSGKTICQFIYINLRCILIPDHVAAVYFPVFQTGKDEFWETYFPRFMEQGKVFREQFYFHHNKYGEHKFPGAWVMDYKNASRLIMPAPNFEKDAETQASRRFNTLMVDEWLRAEGMGDAISRQLVERTTRQSFNQNHPIWCNHLKFLGHAESPSHKGYANRVKPYKRQVLDGSQRHALITFNYLDWTPPFAKKYRVDSIIRSQQVTLTADQFERQMLGIWTRDGAAYYSEMTLHRNCRREVVPMMGRQYENEYNFLGFDVAQSTSGRADYTTAVNYRIVEVNDELKREVDRKNKENAQRSTPNAQRPTELQVPAVTFVHENRKYNASFPFATRFKSQDAAAIAGYIHWLHSIFGYSRIVLDPRGGGLFVYGQLVKPRALVHGQMQPVMPLCTIFEPITADKQPIVSFFQRGGELDQAIQPQFLRAEEGFIEAWHQKYREGWEAGAHHWSLALEDRNPAEVGGRTPNAQRPTPNAQWQRAEGGGWTRDQVIAQRILDIGLKELASVRQLTKDDMPLTSKAGFRMFEARGKKDVAYGSLYAFAAGQLWLKQMGSMEESEAAAACAVF